MAGSSLIALIDDITTVLDDVAVLTKVAAKKTAGVVGDDLAVNAEQVTGVQAARELPVVWAVAKGSLLNKVILVPAALLVSAVAPWAITPLLMLGGVFLCYEACEKVAHRLLQSKADDEAHHAQLTHAVRDAGVDLVAFERDKVRGAIRTDFILSAEIVTITLGTVAGAPFTTRAGVLAGMALLMTVGVYGLVAGIVKLDDVGAHLSARVGTGGTARLLRSIGRGILRAAPYLMKTLSIAGTTAMLLVGGGIIAHGVPALHHWIDGTREGLRQLAGVGAVLGGLTAVLANLGIGVVAGGLVLLAALLVRRITAPERSGDGHRGCA